MSSAAVCTESIANADLLGLGVRIGTYLQVLSAIVNLKLDSHDAPGSAWLQASACRAVELSHGSSVGRFLSSVGVWPALLSMPSSGWFSLCAVACLVWVGSRMMLLPVV
jgi:hypothetical protein